MDIILQARELGKLIQTSDEYKNYITARDNSDKDTELQKLIGDFNIKRMEINQEAQKDDRNEEVLQNINMELRKVYAEIMGNENMSAYNEAKGELDGIVQMATAIITMSAEGEDPATCEPNMGGGCGGGDCSSCGGGCH